MRMKPFEIKPLSDENKGNNNNNNNNNNKNGIVGFTSLLCKDVTFGLS